VCSLCSISTIKNNKIQEHTGEINEAKAQVGTKTEGVLELESFLREGKYGSSR
jgi:hypothetical protein